MTPHAELGAWTFAEITPHGPPDALPDFGPPLRPADVWRQRPDATWRLRDPAGELAARGSLWWRATALRDGRHVGLIGHYAARDVHAGRRWLDHACAQLQEHGCREAFGPMDGNTWQDYRLVVESGDEPPFFLEPSHPTEWVEHFRRGGFTEAARYYSALCTELERTDAGLDALRHRLEMRAVRVRAVRLDDLDAELRCIHKLTIACFAGGFLFTPIALDDFVAQYRRLMPIVRPELVLIAEQRGRMIGFAFALPDVLRSAGDTIVLKTLAVDPEFQSTGVGRLLAGLVHRTAHALGYRRAIHALMPDDGAARTLSEIIARPLRRYALFGRPLGAGP